MGRFHGLAIEHRREHLVELVGGHATDGGLPINELFLLHFDREPDGGQAGAFAVAGLEHENLALLDGELEVLHVLEMAFENLADAFQLGVGVGQHVLKLDDGSGVRMPATTSSPWAFIRNSP